MVVTERNKKKWLEILLATRLQRSLGLVRVYNYVMLPLGGTNHSSHHRRTGEPGLVAPAASFFFFFFFSGFFFAGTTVVSTTTREMRCSIAVMHTLHVTRVIVCFYRF